MDLVLMLRGVQALAIVGLLLLTFWWIARVLGRGRLVVSADKRLVSVIESTYLSQHTTLHVVKIGDKYYAVGGGAGHLAMLGEVPAESVVPWIEGHRRVLSEHAASIGALIGRLRPPRA
jgi:flagellar biogenesis protein FliO